MSGRPWIRILLVIIGFALAGIPVWSMTREHATQIPAAGKFLQVVPASASVVMSLTFAVAPTTFDVKLLGSTLAGGSGPDRAFAYDLQLALPPEGVDLLVKADWPKDVGETAVRIRVTRADEVLVDQTFWATNSMVEAVTIPSEIP